MRDVLTNAILGGCEYLAARQGSDGHWEEYRLPTGRSDAWVTAYVGLALAAASDVTDDPRSWTASARGGRWLLESRPYARGWGYNGATGADADSTAYAIALLRRTGLPVAPEDVLFLRTLFRGDGGVATYDGPGAWGVSHTDVTPIAYEALAPSPCSGTRRAASSYFAGTRRPDGTWPCYWWRTCHYATFHVGRLARAWRLRVELPRPSVGAGDRAVHTIFDLAFVAGCCWLFSGASEATTATIGLLLEHRRANGGWPGGHNLRVTHHECLEPWEAPRGVLYEDDAGLITTASVVRVLSEVVREW
jgi:hypothetical protein